MEEKGKRQKKESTFILNLGWTFGALFLLVGVISLFAGIFKLAGGEIVLSLVIIILSLGLLPPTYKLLKYKLNIPLSLISHIVLIIICAILILISLQPDNPAPQQNAEKQTVSCQKCSADTCYGTNYYVCKYDAQNCSKEENVGRIIGKCGVSCLNDSSCKNDEKCISFQCCSDECTKGQCIMTQEYVACEKSAGACNKAVNIGRVKGQCGVECLHDSDCNIGLRCNATFKCSTYDFHEVILAGDFKWVFESIWTTQSVGGDYFETKADGMFLILGVRVENIGKSSKILSSSYVILVDNQGREFSPKSYVIGWDNALDYGEINPGIVKEGDIIFDVPPDIKVVNIRVMSGTEASYKELRKYI